MAITETVQGRYHTIVSSLTGATNILSELTAFLTSCHVNPRKVLDVDVTNKVIVFFN
ncbi:MAG: hypothetical protein WC307_06565 [Candidatus Nanoarchaeia archaeon]|jgi:hypothetical protein